MLDSVRTAMLIGEDGTRLLAQRRVAVFGIGGVGGYVCEALARAGIGALDLFDNDIVTQSNLNRQIIALHSTIGRLKVDVMAERIMDINPQCRVQKNAVFYLPDVAEQYPFTQYDYVVDALDTVSAKLEIVQQAKAAHVPLVCAMGTGNKLDAAALAIMDISQTRVCPLARVMRRELKKRGITQLDVLCSTEPPQKPAPRESGEQSGAYSSRTPPGSISYVPGVAGLLLAGQVIKQLLGDRY